jgi:hypothetical protein
MVFIGSRFDVPSRLVSCSKGLAGLLGGWPTFTFFVKVGTHAAGVAI